MDRIYQAQVYDLQTSPAPRLEEEQQSERKLCCTIWGMAKAARNVRLDLR